jgi:hypothetical protein
MTAPHVFGVESWYAQAGTRHPKPAIGHPDSRHSSLPARQAYTPGDAVTRENTLDEMATKKHRVHDTTASAGY